MTNLPKTAVILAAGKGSRRLPITRAVDKAMLPIGNRPVIDYVVEQCVDAGVERILFVVSNNDSLIKKYYTDKFKAETEYPWLGLTRDIACTYIQQPHPQTYYGTAAALACTESLLGDQMIIVTVADGFIYNSSTSVFKSLVETYKENPTSTGLVAGLTVSAQEASSYAVMEYDPEYLLTEMTEKPLGLDMGKTYPVNVSCYLLSAKIFSYIHDLKPVTSEYFLPDAVMALAQHHTVKVVPVVGKYLDAGQLAPWIDANLHIHQR